MSTDQLPKKRPFVWLAVPIVAGILVDGASEGLKFITHGVSNHTIDRELTLADPLILVLCIALTRSVTESLRSVLSGELDLALVTAPPKDAQITAVAFARAPLYVAIPDTHQAARKEHIGLRDLAADEWILLAKHVHPIIHDAILQTAKCEGINPQNAHDVMTSHQAVHFVSERLGIAIFTKPAGLRLHEEGVVIKPLSDTALWFDNCLIMRAEGSPRIVNEYAMAFLRRVAPQRAPARQIDLPLGA